MSGAFDSLPFDWAAGNFATHEAHMDDEHKGLFASIDNLDKNRTVANFESLAGLVIQHFKDEEALGLSAAHVQQHHDLLAIATAKLGDLKSGAASVDQGLVDFLKSWLKNHIKATDIPSYGH